MIEQVKALLGITDNGQDDKLRAILGMVSSRLCLLLDEVQIPEELEFIAVEVAVMRFNRIGSEGMASHSVGGESISYQSGDFEEYMPLIDTWKRDKKGSPGVIRFL